VALAVVLAVVLVVVLLFVVGPAVLWWSRLLEGLG
jgi:hypothetical protein